MSEKAFAALLTNELQTSMLSTSGEIIIAKIKTLLDKEVAIVEDLMDDSLVV